MVHSEKGRGKSPQWMWSCSIVYTSSSKEPNPVFPLGAMAWWSLIQCSWRVYRTKLPQIRRINCTKIFFCISTKCQTSFQPSGTLWLPARSWPVFYPVSSFYISVLSILFDTPSNAASWGPLIVILTLQVWPPDGQWVLLGQKNKNKTKAPPGPHSVLPGHVDSEHMQKPKVEKLLFAWNVLVDRHRHHRKWYNGAFISKKNFRAPTPQGCCENQRCL